MKRFLCICLLLVLLVGAVWASGQKEEGAATGKAKIVWWTWVDWTKLLNAFMEKNPNIEGRAN
jgi:ABC-type glycerol-3-phosphate transport system substrate-binding protein